MVSFWEGASRLNAVFEFETNKYYILSLGGISIDTAKGYERWPYGHKTFNDYRTAVRGSF